MNFFDVVLKLHVGGGETLSSTLFGLRVAKKGSMVQVSPVLLVSQETFLRKSSIPQSGDLTGVEGSLPCTPLPQSFSLFPNQDISLP